LQRAGVNVSSDTRQLRLGDDGIAGLRQTIFQADFFSVILSPEAIASPWVQRELEIALARPRSVSQIIPILYRSCDLPKPLSRFKSKCVDFAGDRDYSEGFRDLLLTLGLVVDKAGSETSDLLRSLSGIWIGAWTFNRHPRLGKLYIETSDSTARASARISSFRFLETLLEEYFEINVRDHIIRLIGTGYRFLRRGSRKGWYLDTFELQSKECGTVLAGTRFDTFFPKPERVVFRREAELDQRFQITQSTTADLTDTRAARLDGRQIEALRDALCAAFNQDSLDAMLQLRLNKNRAQLIGSGNLKKVVLELIQLAMREGWEFELIRKAWEFNPGHPKLKCVCAELLHFDLP
jgi:hypothetical protein